MHSAHCRLHTRTERNKAQMNNSKMSGRTAWPLVSIAMIIIITINILFNSTRDPTLQTIFVTNDSQLPLRPMVVSFPLSFSVCEKFVWQNVFPFPFYFVFDKWLFNSFTIIYLISQNGRRVRETNETKIQCERTDPQLKFAMTYIYV